MKKVSMANLITRSTKTTRAASPSAAKGICTSMAAKSRPMPASTCLPPRARILSSASR